MLHFGSVKNSEVEQVKGVTYSLEQFLGPHKGNTEGQASHISTGMRAQTPGVEPNVVILALGFTGLFTC